jgi:hypothetical protein
MRPIFVAVVALGCAGSPSEADTMTPTGGNQLPEWLLGQQGGAAGAGFARVYGATSTPGPWVNDAGGFNLLAPGSPIVIPTSALVAGAVVDVAATIQIESTAYPTPTVFAEVGLNGSLDNIVASTPSPGALANPATAVLRGESLVMTGSSGTAGQYTGWVGGPGQFAVPTFNNGDVGGSLRNDVPLEVFGRFGLAAPDANVRARIVYARVIVYPPAP